MDVDKEIMNMYDALAGLSMHPDEKTLECLNKVEEEIKKLKERWKNVPKVVSKPDLKGLIDVCKEYIETIKIDGRHMKDGEHWIFEEALMAIYGRDIFDWVNAHDRGY